ncbi:MAG: DnaJ domain-containing protein [Gammaproteobacteria bacterium]|nr:DnaJ domain-containing protein [Gammaproteobacteria bacterium]MBQ0840170.1 DnaJ domain-containing protein [Gammaproteobacteria bacterium]
MPRLLLLIAVAFIVWYFIQQAKGLQKKPEKERKAALWRIIFIGLFGVTLALVLSGRAHWLAAALAGLLPLLKNSAGLLMRALPMLQAWQRSGGPKFGPTLKSESLEIKVNIGNGSIDGTVLKGELAGQALSSLSREQLDPLLAQYHSADPQAARLLSAYMARRFQGSGEQQYQQQYSQPETATAQSEAWQILGLEEGASKEEIIKAHKRLIQKLHPDRGGNDYLAAKINAAKDTLISKT